MTDAEEVRLLKLIHRIEDLEELVKGLEKEIDDLDSRMYYTESDISTIQDDIYNLESRVE